MNNKKQNKTKQTSRKRFQSRLLALVGCLLLVSVLALPCFADYSNGSFEPIVGTVDAYSGDVAGVGTVNFDGFTRFDITNFNSIPVESSPGSSVDLAFFGAGDAYIYYPDETEMTYNYYRVTGLHYHAYGNVRSLDVYVRNAGGDEVEFGYYEGSYLLVRNYPFDIVEGSASAWSALQFDAYAVGSVTPDVPDVPDVPSVPGDADKVTTVWTGIMSWIVTALASVQSVFYVNGSLTFIGMLSVVGVSISIGFLIIGVVQRFLHLRG